MDLFQLAGFKLEGTLWNGIPVLFMQDKGFEDFIDNKSVHFLATLAELNAAIDMIPISLTDAERGLSKMNLICTPEHVSGAENGAERAENRLQWSGAVSRVQKIKWSGAGAGGRQNGNGAVSGINQPLKIRSTTRPLM